MADIAEQLLIVYQVASVVFRISSTVNVYKIFRSTWLRQLGAWLTIILVVLLAALDRTAAILAMYVWGIVLTLSAPPCSRHSALSRQASVRYRLRGR